jgi:hypothetical protein
MRSQTNILPTQQPQAVLGPHPSPYAQVEINQGAQGGSVTLVGPKRPRGRPPKTVEQWSHLPDLPCFDDEVFLRVTCQLQPWWDGKL